MAEVPEENVRKLRNEFVIAEQTFNLKEMLIEKREELDQNIINLSEEISEENLALHQNQTKSPEELKELSDSLETKKLLLNRIKDTLQQLDEKLDEYELFSMEMVLFLREELIKAILESHPEQNSNYEKLSQDVDEQIAHLELWNSLGSTLEIIEKNLDTIVHQRDLVRRRGILRYIFGPNPNTLITKNLKAAYQLAHDMIPKIENALIKYPEAEELRLALQECQSIVMELKVKTTPQWGWGKIDQEIVPLYYSVLEQNIKIKEAGEHLKTRIQEAQENINQWIDAHSKQKT